jgi:hypothetical protein
MLDLGDNLTEILRTIQKSASRTRTPFLGSQAGTSERLADKSAGGISVAVGTAIADRPYRDPK